MGFTKHGAGLQLVFISLNVGCKLQEFYKHMAATCV